MCGCAKDVLGLHLVAMGSVWMLTISWDALHSGDEDTENVFERPFGNFHDPPLLSLLLHTLLYNIRYPNKEIDRFFFDWYHWQKTQIVPTKGLEPLTTGLKGPRSTD